MTPRDPAEPHRGSTPLELFFDLCFAVAIATAVSRLHLAMADRRMLSGVVSYLVVFFAIWWAWMGFSWFASAYDVDDAPYRLGVFVQISGALVLAAGVPAAFESTDLSLFFLGYLIMRLGLGSQRLRAAHAHPARRTNMLRHAAGELGLMPLWAVVVFGTPQEWILPGFAVMAMLELAVPAWAERAGASPWHAAHMASRYARFTIIVLGQSLLAGSLAVQTALRTDRPVTEQLPLVVGGLLLVFAMWSAYFSRPAHRFLTSNRIGFRWGYGHYVIFASGGAVGAGLAVGVDHTLGATELGDAAAGATVTVPVAVFLTTLCLLHLHPRRPDRRSTVLFGTATALVLAATFAPWPVLASGVALALVGALVVLLDERAVRRT